MIPISPMNSRIIEMKIDFLTFAWAKPAWAKPLYDRKYTSNYAKSMNLDLQKQK